MMRRFRDGSSFGDSFDKVVRTQSDALWQVLMPMMHLRNRTAHEDLDLLVQDALNLATAMYCGPYEWRLTFPPVNSPFHNNMINRDLVITGDPNLLMARDTRIKLAISPSVTIRDNANSTVKTLVIRPSMVLLKPKM